MSSDPSWVNRKHGAPQVGAGGGAVAPGTASGLAVLCPNCLHKPAPSRENRGCAGDNHENADAAADLP
jgi:hypothetical protein